MNDGSFSGGERGDGDAASDVFWTRERELLATTLDQLRTFRILHRTKSVGAAAAELGRDQSSVKKQLDGINKHFKDFYGEELATVPSGRGKSLVFTRSGEEVAALSDSLFETWLGALADHRRRRGKTLSIGATLFTFDYDAGIWAELFSSLRSQGVEFRIRQIHTRAVKTALEDKWLDIAFGGVIPELDVEPIDGDTYDSLEWAKENFVLVSNYAADELPDEVSPDDLRDLELVFPREGIIAEFLRAWVDDEFRDQLKALDVDGDVPFILSLLRSNAVRGCTIVPYYLVESNFHTRGLEARPLNAPERRDLHVVATMIVRKSDRATLPDDHPLKQVWRRFEERADSAVTEAGR